MPSQDFSFNSLQNVTEEQTDWQTDIEVTPLGCQILFEKIRKEPTESNSIDTKIAILKSIDF